ncbi:phage antirepressor N-terminal domain-containing protein [Ideonella livida]|uniref:KilA-N domain-containing protein n=1 Tax=Ideonella livida TaxID=2707176 RepID=A0A7C9TGI3_9BURK|nr:phage antirepressor N-terminal domain-containing protein [Ideonella livida]NDY89721.1 hypothetical protein [Ideonella livida]
MSQSVSTLILGDASVRQLDGLFSLNDLHAAAGNLPKDRPQQFLRRQETQALIAELGACANSRTPLRTINDGQNNGTYACRELVIAYAAWISAAFHLKVLRVFLASTEDGPAKVTYEAVPERIASGDVPVETVGAIKKACEAFTELVPPGGLRSTPPHAERMGDVTVQFEGSKLYLVGVDGVPYVQVRSVCVAVGMSAANQIVRLKSDLLRYKAKELPVWTDTSGVQQSWCIPVATLDDWLTSVGSWKVSSATRSRLSKFISACAARLQEAWNEFNVANRAPQAAQLGRGDQKQVPLALQAPQSGAGKLTSAQIEEINTTLTDAFRHLAEGEGKSFMRMETVLLAHHFGVPRMEDIPARMFGEALSWLARQIARRMPSGPAPQLSAIRPGDRFVATMGSAGNFSLEPIPAGKSVLDIDDLSGLIHAGKVPLQDVVALTRVANEHLARAALRLNCLAC